MHALAESILDSDLGRKRACVILGNASLRLLDSSGNVPDGYVALPSINGAKGRAFQSALFVPSRSFEFGLLDANNLSSRGALAGIGLLLDLPRGIEKFGGEKLAYTTDGSGKSVVSHKRLREGDLLPINELRDEIYRHLFAIMSQHAGDALINNVLVLTNQRARREMVRLVGALGSQCSVVHHARRGDSVAYEKEYRQDSVVAVPCPGVIAATHNTFASIFTTKNVHSNWDVGRVVSERALKVGGNFVHRQSGLTILERRFGPNKCVEVIFPDGLACADEEDCDCV